MLQALALGGSLAIDALGAASSAKSATQNMKNMGESINMSMDLIGKQSDLAGRMVAGVESQYALEKEIGAAQAAAARTASMARHAQATAAIADTTSLNKKAEQIQFQGDIAATQGKADSLMRLRNYNDLAAAQMASGAASGRTIEGSLGAIIQGDYEQYQWDKLFNEKSQVIEQAAYSADATELYQSGYNNLLNAGAQVMVGRATSMNDMRNSYIDAQSRAIGREAQMTDISSRMLGLESQTLGLFNQSLQMQELGNQAGDSFTNFLGNAAKSVLGTYGLPGKAK